MGGFFGVASKQDCVFDLFFGTDYHSHLGTRRAGMAVYSKESGFDRAIHNIENAPFRTKFDKDVEKMSGYMGIGCISDYEPQPLIVRSHHGTYAIMTVGKINNTDQIVDKIFLRLIIQASFLWQFRLMRPDFYRRTPTMQSFYLSIHAQKLPDYHEAFLTH